MTKNDELIMSLRQKIEEKKAHLKKIAKFSPVTNCMLELYGKMYNLHTLNKQTANLLLVYVHSLEKSANELELKVELCGYALSSWVMDLKAKADQLSIDEEKDKLKQMESRLYNLLSEDKKIELELDEIMKSIE